MGKNRSKKRRLAAVDQATPSSIVASLTGKRKHIEKHDHHQDDSDDDHNDEISPEEVEITIQTLNAIAKKGPDLLDNLKSYKELRRALCPFQKAWSERFNPIDYTAKVTTLLETKQWSFALFALDGCAYYCDSKLKRGTIQRWVRFCDECEIVGLKLKLIAAILKCTSSSSANAESDTLTTSSFNKHDPRRTMLLEGGDHLNEMEISRRITWDPPSTKTEKKSEATIDDTDWTVPDDIRVVYHVPASDRKPPNHHDLFMSCTSTRLLTSTIDFDSSCMGKHFVDDIPGAMMLTNVLLPHECKRLMATAERMGYIPDHPVENTDPTGIDTCEWLAMEESNIIFERVVRFLPPTIQEEPVTGINARWRLFRYGPESVYRPHIDGSWPCSKLDKNNKYVSDDAHRSRLTFLVYLNDGFEGGGTTFYLPKDDGLETVSVTPKAGNVLIFPQGNTASLVHEGSKVESPDCCKYVIRTDVLFKKK